MSRRRLGALIAGAILAASLLSGIARANDFVRHFGGPGTGNGQFGQPLGVAVDPRSGDLYVSDTSRNLVDKFDSGGNFLFSFGGAGAGAGQFNTPRGLAVDPGTGDVYVADLNNNRVEKFDSAGNFELQFGSSGAGPGQFNHPSMIAIDPANRDVYVTDLTNARVEKFDPEGNFLSQFGSAGTGNGQFNGPNGVAVDPGSSNVYVTDFNNQRVEKFTSAGTFVSAFGAAGTGPGQFGGPFAVTVDPGSGDVYVSDGNRRVQKFDSSGDYLAQFGSPGGGDGQFNGPGGVAVDLSGNVYVADGTNARVDEFDSSGSFLSQFGATGTGNGRFSNALGAAVDSSTGEIYVLDGGPANRAQKFSSSGSFESTFGSTGTGAGQLTNPHAPAVDGSTGDVYVVDSGNNRVERFDPSGQFISQFGASGTANGQFSNPLDAAVEPATRDVYVTDENNNRVEKFDPQGNFLSKFGAAGTGPGQFNLPFGVAVDPGTGSIYVSDFANNRVEKFDSGGGFLLQFGGTGAGAGQFAGPREIAVDPANGHVFVLDGGHSRVQEFSSRGAYLSQFGTSGSTPGQLSSPDGLALDPATAALYVVSNGGTAHVAKFGSPPAPVCATATGRTTNAFPVGIQLSCSSSTGFSPSYQVTTQPGHGTLSDFNPYTGFFFYTPSPGFVGTDTFSYHGLVDGVQSPDRTVTVTVVSTPVCHDVSASIAEGAPGGVQLDCTDASGSPLAYTIDSPPSQGTLGTVSPSGAVVYTPNAGFTGVDSFLYHATNADGISSSIQVAHIAVNPPPTCEDTFLTTADGKPATATLSCVDRAGAALNYAIVSSPAHGSLGSLHQSTGQVTYTPAAGFSGADSFTYIGSSTNGTSNIATIHVTVNARPSCGNASASTGEGNPVVVALDCVDAAGASVSYSIVSAPLHGALSSIRQATGEVTYTPTSGYTGADSFKYRATSANGVSNTATVSLTVNPRPSCQGVSVTTGTGTPIVANLDCSDANAAVSYAVDAQPAHGSLGSLSQATGQVTYTPNAGYSGSDSFTYHGISANGSSTVQTVSITVVPAPVCHRVNQTTSENASAAIVKLNCTDSTAAPLTYAIDTEPAHGTLGAISQATAQVGYTPDSGFSGFDSFTYHASSSNGISTSQTVTVRVRPLVTLGTPTNNFQTKNTKPLFSGTASNGESDGPVAVQVVAGTSISGGLVETLHADVSPAGKWSVSSASALADGTYTARASQSDAAGVTGLSNAHTFTVDTVAPAPRITAPVNCSSSTNATPTFSGTASTAAGDLPAITVKLFSGIGTATSPIQTLTTAASGGSWSIPASASLPGGTYTAEAQQSDAAGNTTVTTPNTFNVATTIVSITAPTECSSTRHATPTFSGKAGTSTGDSSTVSVKVFPGFTTSGAPLQTVNTTASAGNWSVPATAALADGTYTAQAVQTLASGTSTSPGVKFTVDTIAPSLTLTSPANGSSTSDTTPTFSGAAGTATGDKPTITVKVFAGPSASGSPVQTLTTSAAGGQWSLSPATALAAGTYTAQASQRDAAGNVGSSAPITFTIG